MKAQKIGEAVGRHGRARFGIFVIYRGLSGLDWTSHAPASSHEAPHPPQTTQTVTRPSPSKTLPTARMLTVTPLTLSLTS